jgi:hypothetical protein
VTDAKGDGSAKEPGFPLSNEEIDGVVGRSAALGGFLHGGEATNIVTAYEREDQRAIEEQGRFSDVATRLNGTVLVTACIGAHVRRSSHRRACESAAEQLRSEYFEVCRRTNGFAYCELTIFTRCPSADDTAEAFSVN